MISISHFYHLECANWLGGESNATYFLSYGVPNPLSRMNNICITNTAGNAFVCLTNCFIWISFQMSWKHCSWLEIFLIAWFIQHQHHNLDEIKSFYGDHWFSATFFWLHSYTDNFDHNHYRVCMIFIFANSLRTHSMELLKNLNSKLFSLYIKKNSIMRRLSNDAHKKHFLFPTLTNALLDYAPEMSKK